MRFKKIYAVLISGLMLLSIALAGCDTTNENKGNIDDNNIEDITVEGIDKSDPYTWFDVTKTDLPSLEACKHITNGMTLNQVIRKIGKPQREIGYGATIMQFDVDDGSILTVTFDMDLKKIESNPNLSTYDYLVVCHSDFDREIPDVFFPYYGPLNNLFSWIHKLNIEKIVGVRYEQAFIGVAPAMLKNISYSTNSIDIQSAYRLLSSPLKAISDAEGQIVGGGYVKYDFFTANNETYSITVRNNTVQINNQYYKFIDKFYYAFLHSDLDCHSFITYDTPYFDEYEIYTYADESVKVGEFGGLGEFEFCIYDGLIENTPSYYLKSSAVNLLILSGNQFMIEGSDNTIVYQITGEKDFSALFEANNE